MNHLLTLVVLFSTRGWHTAYSAKFRKNKDADEEEKEEMAHSAFVTACMADSALQSRSSARGTLTLTLCSCPRRRLSQVTSSSLRWARWASAHTVTLTR